MALFSSIRNDIQMSVAKLSENKPERVRCIEYVESVNSAKYWKNKIKTQIVKPKIEPLQLTQALKGPNINSDIKSLQSSNETFNKFIESINIWPESTTILSRNGYDDINWMCMRMKSTNYITDESLRDLGIKRPGDRAKILLGLEDLAGTITLDNRSSLFYRATSSNINVSNELWQLFNWLKKIKLDFYFLNLTEGGYFSLSLILTQQKSK